MVSLFIQPVKSMPSLSVHFIIKFLPILQHTRYNVDFFPVDFNLEPNDHNKPNKRNVQVQRHDMLLLVSPF